MLRPGTPTTPTPARPVIPTAAESLPAVAGICPSDNIRPRGHPGPARPHASTPPSAGGRLDAWRPPLPAADPRAADRWILQLRFSLTPTTPVAFPLPNAPPVIRGTTPNPKRRGPPVPNPLTNCPLAP